MKMSTGQRGKYVLLYFSDCNTFVIILLSTHLCTRSLMDRTEASDAFNAGSIPVSRRIFKSPYFQRNSSKTLKIRAFLMLYSFKNEW